MATVDRVLPWRRNSVPAGGRGRAARRRLPVAPPEGQLGDDHPGLRAGRRRAPRARCASRASRTSTTRSPSAEIVAELGLDDITIAAALLHDAVEDTGITLDDVTRRVRPRRRRDRRRRHQARAHPVRLEGGAAGRHHAQDARGDGEGRPRPDHQAVRPAAQHAHDRGAAGRGSRSASRRRRSTSTRRWRTASACRT